MELLELLLLPALQEASSLQQPPYPHSWSQSRGAQCVLRPLELKERKNAFHPLLAFQSPISRMELETTWQVNLGNDF